MSGNKRRIATGFVLLGLLTFIVYEVSRETTKQSMSAIVMNAMNNWSTKLNYEATETNSDTRTLKLVHLRDSDIVLDANMSLLVAENLYTRYFNQLHYVCEDYIRLGMSQDGGWDVCLIGPYKLAKPCLVYSFGINNDFSFDDAVSIKYGCTVRAFDPSMGVSDHRRGPNIWFYNTGIGGTDNQISPKKWKLKTLQTIVDELGDSNRIIDYLKLDVEDAEWESLEAIYKTDLLQSRVKQFGLEIHYISNSRTTAEFYRRWKIMKYLEDIGFRRWYWHFNLYGAYFRRQFRSCCYEMVYINTAFLNVTSATTAVKTISA